MAHLGPGSTAHGVPLGTLVPEAVPLVERARQALVDRGHRFAALLRAGAGLGLACAALLVVLAAVRARLAAAPGGAPAGAGRPLGV